MEEIKFLWIGNKYILGLIYFDQEEANYMDSNLSKSSNADLTWKLVEFPLLPLHPVFKLMCTVSALITISSSPITIRYKNNEYVLNGINSVALPHKFSKPDSIFFSTGCNTNSITMNQNQKSKFS